jgi:hypothetical protein
MMERIICPHCGAGNRPSPSVDACWQCEKDLGNVVGENKIQTIQSSVPFAQVDDLRTEPPFWTVRMIVLTTILLLLIFVYIALLSFQVGAL